MWIVSDTGRLFNTDRIFAFYFDSDDKAIYACADGNPDNGWLFARKKNSKEADKYLALLADIFNDPDLLNPDAQIDNSSEESQ